MRYTMLCVFVCWLTWLSQAKSIQRHLTVLQLLRSVGIHQQMPESQRLEFVAELSRHYDAGLQLGPLW